MTSSLLDVQKRVFWKPINLTQILECWTKPPWTPHKKNNRYWKFLGVPPPAVVRPRPQNRCIIFLLKDFFLNSWFCPQAYRGADRRWKSLLDGATDCLSMVWHYITTVSLCLLLSLFWPGRLKIPLNVYELGLNMITLISNLYGDVFLYRPGPVISTCMLEKDIMVLLILPIGKN